MKKFLLKSLILKLSSSKTFKLSLLLFFFLFFFSSKTFAQNPPNFVGFGVDPLNSEGSPDPESIAQTGAGLIRTIYREDEETQKYIDGLIKNGITPVLVLNWEYNADVWTPGGIDNSYVEKFNNTVVKSAVEKYGNKVVYQIWNEPDGVRGTIPLSPEEYQVLLAASYNTIKQTSPDNIVITAGLVSGNVGYLQRIMELSGGQLPADGIGYHPYVDPSQYTAADVLNGILSYASVGGAPIWITEFGWETRDLEKQAEWLVDIFSLLTNEQTQNALQAVMWYAWSDAMNPGFGLVDENGNIKPSLKALLEFILKTPLTDELLEKLKLGLFPLLPLPPPSPKPLRPERVCSTLASAKKPTTFRPAPCESCGDPLPPRADSCATSFQVYTYGRWCLTPPECNGDYTEFYNWKGDVIIDFSKTKVPFAGYGKADEIDSLEDPAVTKYLADYFDGTLLHSEKVPLVSSEQFIKDVFLKGGVFRKLAPPELQDIYKIAMIVRAHRSQQLPEREVYPIRDYVVKNPDPENHPNCQDKKLTQFITELGKKPMLSNFETYQEYYDALKKWGEKDDGCWKVLWSAVPMFSKEDGVGEIYVSAEPPGKIPHSPYRATFPHLPRLYEVTKALQKLLFPQLSAHSIQLSSEDNNNDNLFASTESFSPTNTENSSSGCLGEQTILLAQGEETKQVTVEPYVYLNENGQLEYGVIIRSNGNTDGHVTTELQIDGNKAAGTMNFIPTNGVLHYGTPGSQAPGDVRFFPQLDAGHTVKFMVKCDDCGVVDGAGNVVNDFSQECQTSISVTGELVTNCQAAPLILPPPPSDICQSPDSPKACSVSKTLTDDNPNDLICVSSSKAGRLYAGLTVSNYQAFISSGEVRALEREYNKCLSKCEENPDKVCDCDPCSTVKLSRWISVKPKIPWLDEIWKQTTGHDEESQNVYDTGLFHIFTPSIMENWQPKQAKTPIAEYAFENIEVDKGGGGGGANPNEGQFYYPKLGGVEEAKQCLNKYMLLPGEISKKKREQNPQEFYEICPPFRHLLTYDCCDYPNYQKGLKVSPDCCQTIRETCPNCYEGPKEVKDDPKYCDQAKIDQKNWEEFLGGKEPPAVCK